MGAQALRDFARRVQAHGEGFSGELSERDRVALGEYSVCYRKTVQIDQRTGMTLSESVRQRLGGAPILGVTGDSIETEAAWQRTWASLGLGSMGTAVYFHQWRPCGSSATAPEQRETLHAVEVSAHFGSSRLEMTGLPGASAATFRFSGPDLDECREFTFEADGSTWTLALTAPEGAAASEASVGVDAMVAIERSATLSFRLCGVAAPLEGIEQASVKRFAKLFRMVSKLPAPAAAENSAQQGKLATTSVQARPASDGLVEAAPARATPGEYVSEKGIFALDIPSVHNWAQVPYAVAHLPSSGDAAYDKAVFEVFDFGQLVVVGVRTATPAMIAEMEGDPPRRVLAKLAETVLYAFRQLARRPFPHPPTVQSDRFEQSVHGETLVRAYLAPQGSLAVAARGRRPTAADTFDTTIVVRVARKAQQIVYVVAQDDTGKQADEIAQEFFERVRVR